MIIQLNTKPGWEIIAEEHPLIHVIYSDAQYLISPSSWKDVPSNLEPYVSNFWPMDSDIQLASKKFLPQKRKISLGEVTIGGDSMHTVMMTGPCSVESEIQITACAELCVELGVKVLRAGCFKPRTSPYTFQGLGMEGLTLLARMREKYGLQIITEIRDSTHAEAVIEYTDWIQVGAKAMYDHGILRMCGKSKKPVLLKRGFGSTLQEFVQAAEFILSGGNENVVLCERGIRTFETKSRFTLDLCGVAFLQEHVNLPIILDPSHAMGYAYGVTSLSAACVAMGVDGIIIETHPDPSTAKSDASQQLDFDTFRKLHVHADKVCKAVGHQLI